MNDLILRTLLVSSCVLTGAMLGYSIGWRDGYKCGNELAEITKNLHDRLKALVKEYKRLLAILHPAEWKTDDTDETDEP